jgi:hypothetical protein
MTPWSVQDLDDINPARNPSVESTSRQGPSAAVLPPYVWAAGVFRLRRWNGRTFQLLASPDVTGAANIRQGMT